MNLKKEIERIKTTGGKDYKPVPDFTKWKPDAQFVADMKRLWERFEAKLDISPSGIPASREEIKDVLKLCDICNKQNTEITELKKKLDWYKKLDEETFKALKDLCENSIE